MEIEISTPALLFPALSLLLLAYTNRFLATASLIRLLSNQAKEHDNCAVTSQIDNLKIRLELTKWMQFFGVLSILLCTLSMFGLFLEFTEMGKKVFGLSLISMCFSLLLSLWEVYISTNALNVELQDLDKKCKDN
ncbi:DUF2721 domain-containing protein [Sulfurospirillum arcachonense]|uniref:DUF2721 domain-containing protein n=1 Tax=Sulfurospirillum arcachonense TaxID=57666 RepID=UPI000469BEB0|nr:DUF2721 domain-containing protein [Sulfurospirillum arcachonense]